MKIGCVAIKHMTIPNLSKWNWSTAPDERLYVIGDIHGEFSLLQMLYDAISHDLSERPIARHCIIFLGDMVDRGENSLAVLDFVIELSNRHPIHALRGNHEDMLLSSLQDRAAFSKWRQYGGLETLASFGINMAELMRGHNLDVLQIDFQNRLGKARLNFLKSLPHYYISGDYYFCHAGIDPSVALAHQIDHDLIWMREPFLSSETSFEKMIVHGHSPVEKIEIKHNRIGIDTGAYLTGRLSCLALEGVHMRFADTKKIAFDDIV